MPATPRYRFTIILLVLMFVAPAAWAAVQLDAVAASDSGQASQPATNKQAKLDKLIAKAKQRGFVPVIVGLSVPFLPENPKMDRMTRQQQRQRIADIQGQVIQKISAFAPTRITQFKIVPGIALQANEAILKALGEMPEVTGIWEDVPMRPSLYASFPAIGGNPGDWTIPIYPQTSGGKTGLGWSIAILDTGVDQNHEFFNAPGKIWYPACFSGSQLGVTVCPNSQITDTTDWNAGRPCPLSVANCWHGTHVAGIAAGNRGNNSSFNGVAKDATVIPIQVYSQFTDGATSSYCADNNLPSPCVLSMAADQISALEYVYNLVVDQGIHIAAVNLSLGGEKSQGVGYSQVCDSDVFDAPYVNIVDTLTASNVAVIAAAGNESWTSAMDAPACLSKVISVGSTTKLSPYPISATSDITAFVSLLAPGGDANLGIESAQAGTVSGYMFAFGTSMAAPHVAGAWAVIKQAVPSANTCEILHALQSTGIAVTDTRIPNPSGSTSGAMVPFIQVNKALQTLTATGYRTPAQCNFAGWLVPVLNLLMQ